MVEAIPAGFVLLRKPRTPDRRGLAGVARLLKPVFRVQTDRTQDRGAVMVVMFSYPQPLSLGPMKDVEHDGEEIDVSHGYESHWMEDQLLLLSAL